MTKLVEELRFYHATARIYRLSLAAGSLLAIPLAAAGAAMITFLPTVYARRSGQSLEAIAAVFLLVRLAAIALDPLVGAGIDATRTRFGRFRPWTAAGAVLLVGGGALALSARPIGGIVPLTLCLLALYLGYSIVLTAQTGWLGCLGQDQRARTRAFTWWESATVAGLLMVLLLSAIAAASGDRLAALRWIILIGTPIGALSAMWSGRLGAHPADRADVRAPARLKRDLRVLVDTVLARALLIEFVTAAGSGVLGLLFFLFFEDVRGYTSSQSALLLAIYYAAGVAGAQIWRRLGDRLGVVKALLIAALYDIVCQPTVLLNSGRGFGITAVGMAVAGLSFGFPLLVRALAAARAQDLGRSGGENHAALAQSAVSAAGKLGQAAAQLSFVGLGATGFIASLGTHNSPSVRDAALLIYVTTPLILSTISALTSCSLVLRARRAFRPQPSEI